MIKVKTAIVAVVVGIVITAVTGWIPGFLLFTRDGLRLLMGPYVGASNFGLPVVWRTVIVYPGSPVNYDFTGLVADVVFWVAVAWVVLFSVMKVQKK
jgi:hypothetical protein